MGDMLPRDMSVTVSELNEYISLLMERDDVLSYIQVRGEVSNFKRHPSGHLYFSLKDAGAVLKCVMFRSDAMRLKCEIAEGLEVIATGQVRNYSATGQYQLYVRSVEQDGLGALHIAFEALKKKLASEGLFDQEHKLPIPQYPKTIGVVTSPSGAAIQDMIQILGRRYPLAQIYIYPSLVQGMDAPIELTQGIHYFNEYAPDVIIIGRGGGSIEDLWCFNDETLARAIFESKVPVISAVGHEIDYTICDFVADLRAPTPSAAAELAVPDREELKKQIALCQKRAGDALKRTVALYQATLSKYSKESILKLLSYEWKDRAMALAQWEDRLLAAISQKTDTEKNTLKILAEKLQALSPLGVLARGYSITTLPDNSLLTSKEQVQPGSEIVTHLDSCKIVSCVKEITKEEALHGTNI